MYSLLYEGRDARVCAEELMNYPAQKREIELEKEAVGHAAALLATLRGE